MVNQPIGNHGPLLQGQTRIAKLVLITRLLLVLEVWDGKPTYGKTHPSGMIIFLYEEILNILFPFLFLQTLTLKLIGTLCFCLCFQKLFSIFFV